MKLHVLILSMILAVQAFAGRIITYTATSNVSQEDANNAAIVGVAKQIVSQVNASQTLTKSEITRDGSSTLDETFFSSNNVKSNIKLKGVTIVPEKTDGKGFKATAKLDMDEFTADIQFQMKRIKEDIAKYESSAREALANRLYAKAANDLESARPLVPEYERMLWQLSKVYPLNDSHKLVHDLSGIEASLLAKLSKITLQGPSESFTLTKSEMPEWGVQVSDDQGALSGFPLIAKQGRQTLSEKRSDESGRASFVLRKVNFEKGPYTITVVPNLPMGLLKSAGLDQGIEVSYEVSQKRCEIRLECKQIANLCSAVENALSQKSIFTTDNAKAPLLKTQFTSTSRGSIGSGNNAMSSFDVTFSLKGEKISFTAKSKGVGKNELDANVKALQKMDFADLQKQVAPYCK